jgi:hypothetical protein
MYNGEKMGLFRLKYLKDAVDLFFIVEANVTFSGKSKPKLYLDDDEKILNQVRTMNKTVEIKLQNIPMPKNFVFQNSKGRNFKYDMAWEREKYARS